MSDYNVKNYTEMGGEVTHIGGSLIIEEEAVVEGLPESETYELPVASDTVLGGVMVGEGLSVTEEGVLSADGGETELPIAKSNKLGCIMLGSGLESYDDGLVYVDFIQAGTDRKYINVSGTTEDGNVTVSFESGCSRSGLRYYMPRHESFVEYWVLYNGNAKLHFVGIDDNDYRAFFRGFEVREGGVIKEVIVGISIKCVQDEPDDLVYVRDFATI